MIPEIKSNDNSFNEQFTFDLTNQIGGELYIGEKPEAYDKGTPIAVGPSECDKIWSVPMTGMRYGKINMYPENNTTTCASLQTEWPFISLLPEAYNNWYEVMVALFYENSYSNISINF